MGQDSSVTHPAGGAGCPWGTPGPCFHGVLRVVVQEGEVEAPQPLRAQAPNTHHFSHILLTEAEAYTSPQKFHQLLHSHISSRTATLGLGWGLLRAQLCLLKAWLRRLQEEKGEAGT